MKKCSGPNFPKPYPKPYLKNPVEYPTCPFMATSERSRSAGDLQRLCLLSSQVRRSRSAGDAEWPPTAAILKPTGPKTPQNTPKNPSKPHHIPRTPSKIPRGVVLGSCFGGLGRVWGGLGFGPPVAFNRLPQRLPQLPMTMHGPRLHHGLVVMRCGAACLCTFSLGTVRALIQKPPEVVTGSLSFC